MKKSLARIASFGTISLFSSLPAKILMTAGFFSLFTCLCSAQTINTIAGDGFHGFTGDGGQATAANISGGGDVVFDHSGNMYFCDQRNERIRMVNSSGIINTIAGIGTQGFSGDNGPATAAQFDQPTVLTFDSSGNMYIADAGNYRIRKINTSGIITTFAGVGVFAFSGNGGPATAAGLAAASCVITDDTGNVYIADSYNSQIRKVNTSGIITAWAGSGAAGFSGDGGNALAADIYIPFRICFDKSWNMYIADSYNDRVRMVNTSGIINTVAGNGVNGFTGDGGPATAAGLDGVYGVCADAHGNFFIADATNNRIREVNSSGIISTLAGLDTAAYSGDGGPATAAELDFPTAVNMDYSGNLYVSDYDNYRIREITIPETDEGINVVKGESGEVEVYPNPSGGVFIFVSKGEGIQVKSVEVYNVLGEEVFNSQFPTPDSQFSIDLSNQPGGICLYRIIANNGNIIGEGKIIIQK